MQSLAFSYRLGLTTVSNVIRQAVNVVWEILSPIHIKFPETASDWLAIADGFHERSWVAGWKTYHNCCSTKLWLNLFQLQPWVLSLLCS